MAQLMGLNPACRLLPSGPALSQMQEQKLNQQRRPEPLHDALWVLRARLGGPKGCWRWRVNIKDLLVPLCAWVAFLTNSFLVPPSLLLWESESASYCFKRRI